ncbi:MAG: hypothetical protein ABH834_06830 [Candidatus Altiarchaeota archaeon]
MTKRKKKKVPAITPASEKDDDSVLRISDAELEALMAEAENSPSTGKPVRRERVIADEKVLELSDDEVTRLLTQGPLLDKDAASDTPQKAGRNVMQERHSAMLGKVELILRHRLSREGLTVTRVEREIPLSELFPGAPNLEPDLVFFFRNSMGLQGVALVEATRSMHEEKKFGDEVKLAGMKRIVEEHGVSECRCYTALSQKHGPITVSQPITWVFDSVEKEMLTRRREKRRERAD